MVKALKVAFLSAATLVVGFCLFSVMLWLFALRDPASEQDACTFDSVSKGEFQRMLERAKKQDWTVWPGLSNGIFWPSDRGLRNPTASFEQDINAKLQKSIEQLIASTGTADERLAASHAVMRSIRAEYVNAFDIPDFRQNGILVSTKVHFNYLLPQMRFAPLCLLCLLFWDTSVAIVFDHNIATNTYRFDHVNLLHSNFKYRPKYERLPSVACPSFPRNRPSVGGTIEMLRIIS